MKAKEYTNDEITIIWRPDKCIHSGECVRSMPKVFADKDKFIIDVDSANTAELIEQVAKCPSGALEII